MTGGGNGERALVGERRKRPGALCVNMYAFAGVTARVRAKRQAAETGVSRSEAVRGETERKRAEEETGAAEDFRDAVQLTEMTPSREGSRTPTRLCAASSTRIRRET